METAKAIKLQNRPWHLCKEIRPDMEIKFSFQYLHYWHLIWSTRVSNQTHAIIQFEEKQLWFQNAPKLLMILLFFHGSRTQQVDSENFAHFKWYCVIESWKKRSMETIYIISLMSALIACALFRQMLSRFVEKVKQ